MMEDKDRIEEEKVAIRHTINAEETFTLAKDVFDLRCLIKNIYHNRAVIARRLNVISLSVSFIFTVLYVAYILFTGLLNKLSAFTEIALYGLIGLYCAVFIVSLILMIFGMRAKAKNIKRLNKVLSVFRFTIRLLSLAMTIVAIVNATIGGEYAVNYIALDILLLIFSVLCLIVQAIPLLCGGFGRLARWLLSPVKMKCRFSTVALEWYELTVTDNKKSKASTKKMKKVSKKYYDEIGRCLDYILIPSLGKKYVSAIKPVTVLTVVDKASEEERPIVEGVLKSIFAYAAECGYVVFDPCKDLHFEGSIEEEDKPKKKVKDRLFGVGKKIGLSILDKYIEKKTEPDVEDK